MIIKKNTIQTSLFTLFSILLFISGCSIQKQNIVQGRLIDPTYLEQLELGMSKEQVRITLGSPALIDTFSPNQWVYYHSKTRIDKDTPQEVGTLVLNFNDQILSKITSNEKIIAKKTDKNIYGNTIITESTQKKRGIFNR